MKLFQIKNKAKKEEEKLLDDLKKDINDKFNNLEGINELDNYIKQLDYLLAKSKEISIKNEKIFIIIKIITIQMEKKT